MNPITPSFSWVFAIEENKIREESVNLVFPRGISILLIKSAGQLYAVSNKCAHMACALAAGTLKNETIQYPCHDWKFDIRTGEFLAAREIKIPTYQWQSMDGKIFIHVEEGGR